MEDIERLARTQGSLLEEAFIVATRRKDGGLPKLCKATGSGPKVHLFSDEESAHKRCHTLNSLWSVPGTPAYGVFRVLVEVMEEL